MLLRLRQASMGLLALLFALELLLQVLPVSTATMVGHHHDPDVLTYPSGHRWTVSTGWDLRNVQHLRANNAGFVANRDFVPDAKAVALIGDSFVEASMLDAQDRPGPRLEQLMGGRRPVYALGGPGSALLDYAERLRLAATRWQVVDAVLLLEPTDARQSLCGSGNVHGPCLDRADFRLRTEHRSAPDTIKRIARHSALAQYLVGQVRVRPRALWQTMITRIPPGAKAQAAGRPAPEATVEPVDPKDLAQRRQIVDRVVDRFFEVVAALGMRRLVVLVDGRRDGPPVEPGLADLDRAHLMARLREGGATVVDLEPVFASHKANSSRSLVVGPYDGHLNAVGVTLAMSAAAAVLGVT